MEPGFETRHSYSKADTVIYYAVISINTTNVVQIINDIVG
jgi:hypothetical protein